MIELSSIFCESSNNREFGAWGEVAQATSSQAPLIFSSSKLQRMLQPIIHMSACTSEHEGADHTPEELGKEQASEEASNDREAGRPLAFF